MNNISSIPSHILSRIEAYYSCFIITDYQERSPYEPGKQNEIHEKQQET